MAIDRTPWGLLVDDDGSDLVGTFWTKDKVKTVILDPTDAAILASAATPRVCDGRLTLTALTPVTPTDVFAATAIKWTPYKGSSIGLYDGVSAWTRLAFAELSLSIAGFAANSVFDVFAYNNAGVVAIETLAWTSTGAAATRATALVLQDGVLVKSGATTRRYLGTFGTTTTIGQTEDSAAKRLVWNYTHRVRRALKVIDPAASWTYTTAAYRQANANAANQVAVVIGVAEALLELAALHSAVNTTASPGVFISTAIGLNGVSALLPSQVIALANTFTSAFATVTATARYVPPIGYQFYTWLENSNPGGTTTWNGTGGSPFPTSGLLGSVEG